MYRYEFNPSDIDGFARHIGIQTSLRGNEVTFKFCPYCKGGNGKDKGTFSINNTTGMFKCLRASCNQQGNMWRLAKDFDYHISTEFTRYIEKKPTFKKLQQPKEKIMPQPKAIEYLKKRGISEETAKAYQITSHKDKENVLVFPFFNTNGELVNIKYRDTEFVKGQSKGCKEWFETGCEPYLYGVNTFNGDYARCIITEGQADCISCYEAGVENCFSVPGGKNSFTWYPASYEFLDKFEQVVVFGDYEHGEITLLKELQTRLDCRVKHISKSDYKDCKDANDILLKYGKEYLKQIIDNAIDVPVKKVISLADVEDVDIFKLDKLKTGIKMVDKLLYGGLYFGGVTIITGKPGEGKSSLASQILVNAIDQGYKCFAYSGELPNFLFKNWMVFQTAGSKHIVENVNPYGDMSYGISNINKSLITEWYRDKIWLYDNNSLDDGAESESLIKIITNVIKAYGVRVILLDNLMTAIDLAVEEGTDKYERQSNFVKKLTRIALKFNVLILLVAHKRKNNFSTNENDEVGGSSDIVNLATFAISYAKDKDLKDSERMLRVTKNRLFGRVELSGYPLGFEPKSKRIYGVGDDVNVVYGWDKKFEEEQVEFETPFD